MYACMLSAPAMSDSWTIAKTLQPNGPWPARHLCPWHFPGKNTEVGRHFLLQSNLPDPGIKPMSLMFPAMAGGFFTISTIWVEL